MNLKQLIEKRAKLVESIDGAKSAEELDQIKSQIEELDAQIALLKQKAHMLDALGTKGQDPVTMPNAAAAAATPRTIGAAAAQQAKKRGLTTSDKFAFNAGLKDAAPMGINPGNSNSPVIAATTDVDTRIVEGYRRPLMIADLFGSETISGNALTYYVESATVEGGPSTVAEKAKKPLTSFGDPTPVTVALQKIGAHYKESSELIEDTPWLASSIDGRGMYLHELFVENFLVSQLVGTSGIGATQKTKAAGLTADDIFASMMKVQNATGFAADAVVINPTDYQALRLAKDSNLQYYGGGYFYGQYGNGVVAEQPPLWGLRTVVTSAVNAGQVLVGAFRLGGSVVRKGGVTVNIANTNEDDFVKNLITILIEERLALAVRYPGAFDQITVATS